MCLERGGISTVGSWDACLVWFLFSGLGVDQRICLMVLSSSSFFRKRDGLFGSICWFWHLYR